MITKFWRISLIPIGKTHTHTHTYIHIFFFFQTGAQWFSSAEGCGASFFFFFLFNDSYGACYEAMSYLQVGFLPSFLFLSFSLSVFLFPSSLPPFFLFLSSVASALL